RVQAVHGARAADDLLSLEPVGSPRVLLDCQRVPSQPHEELARLGGQPVRDGERRDQEAPLSAAHGCFLVKGIEMRVFSQSIRMTPPFPCGIRAIVNCSTGRGSGSVVASTRAKSESAA